MKTAAPFLIATALLASCASQPPAWVINPKAEGAFAATECVVDSGNLSLDRQIAVAKARAEVAKQVELRVAAMDKTYTRLTEDSASGTDEPATRSRTLNTAFETVSKQIAEQTLSGLAPERVEFIEWDEKRQLCAMVLVNKPKGREIFDTAMRTAGVSANPALQEALYRDFASAGTE